MVGFIFFSSPPSSQLGIRPHAGESKADELKSVINGTYLSMKDVLFSSSFALTDLLSSLKEGETFFTATGQRGGMGV